MRILLLYFLIIPSCSFAQTAYNDLKDFGYRPNTKQITYTVYPSPVQKAGEWTSDSWVLYVKIFGFNRNGLLINEKQCAKSEEINTAYQYKDSVKIKSTVTTTYNNDKKLSHFSYTDTSITETKLDVDGKPILVATSILNKNKQTVKEMIHIFSNGRFKTLHTIFFTRGNDGFLKAYTVSESPANTKKHSELTVLKRDSIGNPLNILVKTDSIPFSYHIYKYEYWGPEPVRKIKTKTSDIQEEPEWVVQEVFDAARTGNYANLSGLCCPKPDCWHDNDTEGICNIASRSKEKQDEFRRLFEKSEIVREPVIKENRAEIRITYTQYGVREATLHLVKFLGKWYLERM